MWSHITWVLSLAVMCAVTGHSKCPCKNPDWCKPVTDTPKKEVFLFSFPKNASVWQKFDWTRVTTVAGPASPDLMCIAHQHNVRMVILVDLSASILTNPSKRTAWVQYQLKIVQDNYLDGINIDYEGSMPKSKTAFVRGLTELVNETMRTFKKALPYSQVTMDVPYGPGCVAGRCYDYRSLASLVDFFFIMDYDEWGNRVAGPNSGFRRALDGVKSYLSIAPPQKLLLGVPWYGYRYRCSELTKDYKCTSEGRSQIFFDVIYNLLSQTHSQRMWSQVDLTPYFTYTDTTSNATYQIWYDDPESLIYKYNMAAELNIRGVGVWTADCIDYSDTALANAVRHWMWDALPLR